MGLCHPREFPRQRSQGVGPINAPSRRLGTTRSSKHPKFVACGPTGISPDDVGRYTHRCSSSLSTVDFVPPSDYMNMRLPPFYGEHPTTLPRLVQIVG